MRFNIYNSLIVSGFMHFMLAGVLIFIPRPEYRALKEIDISFLFKVSEKETQNQIVRAGTIHLPRQSKSKEKIKSKDVTEFPIFPAMDITAGAVKTTVSSEKISIPSSVEGRSQETSVFTGEKSSVSSEKSSIPSSVEGRSQETSGFTGEKSSDLGIKKVSKSEGEVKSGNEGIDMSGILESLRRRLESLKQYPHIAKRRGIEGTVVVFVKVDPSGNLQDVKVKVTSGFEILDESALSLVKRAFLFKHNIGRDIEFEIPITYRLMR